ncbi:MAG: hypothetical protein HYT10_02230 [Candidatus Levybacteria bacterium]|nr:hypothetical protein [Candidatus Levybacteria bacterium]
MHASQESETSIENQVYALADRLDDKGLKPITVLQYESTASPKPHLVVLFDLRSGPGIYDDFAMARLYGVDEIEPKETDLHITLVSTDTMSMVQSPETARIIDSKDEWIRSIGEKRATVVFGEANPDIEGETLKERVEHILWPAA